MTRLTRAEDLRREEAVAARIATLERVIAWANNSLFGSHSFFLSLNGGEDKEHHLDTAIEKLKEQTRNYWSRIASLSEENERLRKALEASDMALNDWIVTYASEMASTEEVEASRNRIRNSGGRLAYIAFVRAENREALAAHAGEGEKNGDR